MEGRGRVVLGFGVVLSSMVLLFTVPPQYFVAATFVSTSCMLLVSYSLGLRLTRRPSAKAIAVGIGAAVALYLVFFAGNAGIKEMHPLGIGTSSARSIYSLIASPANPLYLQVLVLLFDAAGFESFFRGILQASLRPRLGAGSAPVVAAADAAIHVITLNPLWVATTFIVDLGWGLTYHFTKDLAANFTSHFIWDVLVFIVFPLS
jgi:membrane protease YdiL (CAAX protease family)